MRALAGPRFRSRRVCLFALVGLSLVLAVAVPASSARGPVSVRVVDRGPARPEVALTFDDGYCRACVAGILAVLERTGAHATICPNGVYGPRAWDREKRLVRLLIRRGQLALCNHTFSHFDVRRLSEAALAEELERNERWIERTFGASSRPYFRPPYGVYDAATLRVAASLGYGCIVVWWGTLADSSPRTVAYEVQAARYWGRPGDIILAHGNYPATPKALPAILRVFARRGLATVTLPELLGSVPGCRAHAPSVQNG